MLGIRTGLSWTKTDKLSRSSHVFDYSASPEVWNFPLECFLMSKYLPDTATLWEGSEYLRFHQMINQSCLSTLHPPTPNYNVFNCFPPLGSPAHSALPLPSSSFPSRTTWTHYFYLHHSSQQTFSSRYFLLNNTENYLRSSVYFVATEHMHVHVYPSVSPWLSVIRI